MRLPAAARLAVLGLSGLCLLAMPAAAADPDLAGSKVRLHGSFPATGFVASVRMNTSFTFGPKERVSYFIGAKAWQVSEATIGGPARAGSKMISGYCNGSVARGVLARTAFTATRKANVFTLKYRMEGASKLPCNGREQVFRYTLDETYTITVGKGGCSFSMVATFKNAGDADTRTPLDGAYTVKGACEVSGPLASS